MSLLAMCDICSDILEILESRDSRNNDRCGILLTKKEITNVILYTQLWPQQRQCMCCYTDIKNFSRFNNVIQLILAQAIQFIETLTLDSKINSIEDDEVDVTGLETASKTSRDSAEDGADERKTDTSESRESWTLEEKDRLFQFVSKVFSPGFPLYLAFKHRVPSSLEELAKHDANVLSNYCELNDPDVPLLLLRNVCYFCDSNGFRALAQCFKDSRPETLALSLAHTLVTVCANVRMWMNYRAAAKFMSMIRQHIIGYMCHFTEKDLRSTMARSMTELVWQALKDSRDLSNQTGVVTFDKEGLDLAYKFFTCSTLTLRLAGIAQINSQINMYTEYATGDGVVEVESVGTQLSDWLIENKIIEQIFGPNLHVEIIKQSQVILNFLALECRFTNDHVDVIWGASQLKHCGKQVLDILAMMVKSMDLMPAQHLHGLMQQLEPTAHTEQTLMLASTLTKFLWVSVCAPQNHPTLTLVTRHHGNQPQVFAVTTQPMTDDADLVDVAGEILKQNQFSSSRSDSDDEEEDDEDDDEDADGSGNELEMGEVKQLRHHHHHLQHHHFSGHHLQHHRLPHLTLASSSPLKECWSDSIHHGGKITGHHPQGRMMRNRRFKSSSTDGQRSEGQKSEEDDDDDDDDDDDRGNSGNSDDDDGENMSPPKSRSSGPGKKTSVKMTRKVKRQCMSQFLKLQKKMKQNINAKFVRHQQWMMSRKQRYNADNENEGKKHKRNAEGSKKAASKIDPILTLKRKPKMIRTGLRKGRIMKTPYGLSGVRKKVQRMDDVSDDGVNKKESDEDNEDEPEEVSDCDVDAVRAVSKDNKPSEDEEENVEMENEEDDGKEKSSSGSPSSSSSGSVSSCEDERTVKERMMKKICRTSSPEILQTNISVNRPVARKNHNKVQPVAVHLEKESGLDCSFELSSSEKDLLARESGKVLSGALQDETAGERNIEGSLLESSSPGVVVSDEIDEGHFVGEDGLVSTPDKLAYLQQHLKHQLEGITVQEHGEIPQQIHIFHPHEPKGGVHNDGSRYHLSQSLVDPSMCSQQVLKLDVVTRALADSSSEERMIVMPSCIDDDVTVVSDAVLLGAYAVKDAGRIMQFDEEGNKGITAEELEACLDSTTGESGVILLKQNQSMTGNLVEDILSPEATSNSSRLTNKSEKNMSDFEGEDAISDEEIVTINAQSQYVGIHPMQQQLANMASLYHHHHHHHHHHGHHHMHAHHLHEMFHEAQINSGNRELSSDAVKLNELCQPQNTIIWNLLQDHNIDKLQDGLASEAEKNLSSLVCLTNDRIVKSKFIEACITNLSQNKSVVISLRLLSKVLNSFNQHRGPPATHHMTIWAENELQMTKHFFNNILYYTRAAKQNINMHNIFSHKEEIQARLQFLTCMFSSNGSPDVFRLSTEQVDILWDCLATDAQCSDDFLQWIYNQTKNKDYHALKLDTLKHIFMEKMPQLKPEETSMIGLNLFTQLCHLAITTSGDPSMTSDQIIGIDQLWEIALRAKNTDVSMNAITVLNHHYISVGSVALEKEGSFVEKCMKSLMTASAALEQNANGSLLVMQRALILLTNHLESFHKQHAYHLRLFQLNNQMVQSRFSPGKHLSLSLSCPQKIRVILQTGNSNARTAIEVSPNDLVAELRAEVTHWWEMTHNKNTQHLEKEDGNSNSGSKMSLPPLLNSVFSYGSVRMITQGQELSSQVDDKTLAEMQFKDHQLVFTSQGGSRSSKRVDCQQLISSLYKLPMILLTEDPHFTCLFNLLQQLSSFSPNYSDGDLQEQCSLQTKARVLSRKVWSLLMLLPTNKKMLEAFNSISCDSEAGHSSQTSNDWEELLNPMNPHKLMYSLLIIESLSKPFKGKSKSYKLSGGNVQQYEEQHDNSPERQWKNKFIGSGGFQHLLSILLSGVLQERDGGKRDEWQNDCLACLLLLINSFAISHCDVESHPSELFDMLDSPAKKTGKRRSPERLVVPCVNESILSQINVEAVVRALMLTMFNAAGPRRDYDRLTMTSWAHIDVVRHSMSLLVSLAFSSPVILSTFITSENFSSWLKRMTLEALEPAIRQESCQGLYKLCLGRTSDGQTGYKYLIPVFNSLLPCLTDACSIKSIKKSQSTLSLPLYGKGHDDKEPYGPGCRDYLWLMCQLVDGIRKEDVERSWCQNDSASGSQAKEEEEEEESSNKKTHLVDLSNVTQTVANRIINRGFFEKRHNTVEDDGLVGLAKLCTSLLKHNPPFKTSTNGQSFLIDVFHCLFALPSPNARFLPKCKSQSARTAAYDLLVELVKSNIESYIILHGLLLKQNNKDSHTPYSWDTWPHDEERSKCGYVGLTNLGATCYMATCMQHLFMIHEARKTILEAKCSENTNHIGILLELKKMFAYLLESERKAYNPYSFCKVYTMDHQPLNTGEQKDMTEFFTDLITKLEEMGPELKCMVKSLFGGVLTNNVVSLDCPHVSRTKEEFYTVRCQVADMKNLYESLDEVTVKDMLEGDNMYTCSKCQKKVRAEKRACFCKLPTILCFNTMRYTFNMITMMKEKVNTHFSFPLKLDMSPYMESNLIHRQRNNDDRDKCTTSRVSDMDLDEATSSAIDAALQEDNLDDPSDLTDNKGYEYELIGVTVHTGTADAGHYYSFIRDRTNKNEMGQDRWYLFNDAEVKPFDPAQLASECFGGETTSKTYDSVTEKFMDFSFEKTHSAYMLFYERINNNPSFSMTPNKTASLIKEALLGAAMTTSSSSSSPSGSHKNEEIVSAGSGLFTGGDDDDLAKCKIDLSPDLAEWIWQDNTQFLQDKNIFEHSYFSFMWQMCNYIPTTLPRNNPNIQVSLLATKLSASFILETLIHAKEKPTMLQWIENTTKLFQSDRRCCEWFLDTITEDDWWPQQILIRCPNQTVRQMFQRLVLHVINQVKPAQGKNDDDPDTSRSPGGGDDSCVNRFIRKMLAIIEQDSRLHCRYLAEYFGLILDYAKIRDSECRFLNQINTISILVGFFMSLKQHGDYMSTNDISDEDSERDADDIMNQPDDKYHPPALEKMITLVALLVEKSRAEHKNLQLSEKDMHALLGGRHFPFLFHQIRDSINLRQTCNLIFSLSRYNDRLASNVIQIILNSVVKSGVEIQPFFKLLTMLVEFNGGPPGMPMFLQYVLEKFWQMAELCPYPALEWLSTLVVRNKVAMSWTLQTMNQWMEFFLMAVGNLRVRNAAANLLVSLVPNNNFRQTYRNSRNVLIPHKEPITMSEEAIEVLHDVYGHLLKLLCKARQYVDGQGQGTSKLVAYFSVLNYCLISKTEKLMFSRYFPDLWSLFQPKLSDPQIAINHNKQAMMIFWYHVCLDCPENVKLIVSNPNISKNIAFNYVLYCLTFHRVDHEDQEVIVTNRTMLPAYYGILRMCCTQSPSFTRQLAQHQNIQWAFRNITTHPAQYTAAVDELYRLMQLMVAINPGISEEDLKAIVQFRRTTIQMYLQVLDARNQWQTLVAVFGILLDRDEERIFALQHNGLMLMYDAFCTLHMMHYEATACHVVEDIVHLLNIILQTLSSARKYLTEKKATDVKPHLTAWKDRTDFVKKLLSLLNFYTPSEMRKATFACLREMILIYQFECIQTIVPIVAHAHASFQAGSDLMSAGTYFPRLGQKQVMSKASIRIPRPQFQMFLHINQVESKRGVDPVYDGLLYEAFEPYHHLVDLLLRVAVNQQNLPDAIVKLSAMVAYEGTPLHLPYFAKLWYEIYQTESVDRKWVEVLCSCQSFVEYVDSVLTSERASLNNPHIFQFFCNFFPKIHHKVLTDQNADLIATIISSIDSNRIPVENELPSVKEMERIWSNINGDLKAMQIILSVQGSNKISPSLAECFKCFQQQFLRTLQIYQQSSSSSSSSQFRATSQLRPSTSTTPVNSKKTTSLSSGSDSFSPKLLFSIVTGKTPTKKRKVGPKGESEEFFHSSASSSTSSKSNAAACVLEESSSKRTAKRPLEDEDYDDDDDSTKGKEFSYVVNSTIDVNFGMEKGESFSAASFPSPVMNEIDPASIPEISSSPLTTLHAPALPSTSYDSRQEGTSVQQDDDMDVSDDNDDDDDDDDDPQEGNFKSGRSALTGDRTLPSLSHGKEKPSLIDSVIKNADAVLKLILDRVNEKE